MTEEHTNGRPCCNTHTCKVIIKGQDTNIEEPDQS